MTTMAITDDKIRRLRQRGRLLLLLDAAERAAVTPLHSRRLHAFAYLADVLSPVWSLPAFDGKILKIEGGPHYPDLQEELENLVVLGLVKISDLEYVYVNERKEGARLEGNYALNFRSRYLDGLLNLLGAGYGDEALTPDDRKIYQFMVELAGAMATMNNGEIDIAASYDATYNSVERYNEIIDFAKWTEDQIDDNPSWQVSEQFSEFMPDGATLSPGEKLYLYATYLGKVSNAA